MSDQTEAQENTRLRIHHLEKSLLIVLQEAYGRGEPDRTMGEIGRRAGIYISKGDTRIGEPGFIASGISSCEHRV